MSVRIRNESRPRLLGVVLLFLLSGCMVVQGAKLNPTGWNLLNPALTDNNLATFTTGTQVSIDFGVTNTIDRVYLTGTNRALQYWPQDQSAGNAFPSNPPLGRINVLVGNSWPPTKLVSSWDVPYDAGNPIDTEMDVRFSPISCRYVQMVLATNFTWVPQSWQSTNVSVSPNLTWRVAELEVYGVNGICTNRDCVVESTNSTSNVGPLNLAASDLSYYLTELENYPVPIVPPSQANSYPGTIYNIQDLKPLAPDYNTMMANIANGSLPTNVTVNVSGRMVTFTGWPYRVVLWGVWQFLEDQGVRWVYPSGDGEYVPRGNGVSTSMLPINYTPSAYSIYANFDTSTFEPWAPWYAQSLRQSYLYFWRNRWTAGQAGGVLGGSEIPKAIAPGNLNTNYTEGFAGYPQNFDSVFPTWKLLQNPSWWGYDPVNGWINPTNTGGEIITPSLNNPGLITWTVQKLEAYDAAYPIASQNPLDTRHFNWAYNLLMNDTTKWSQDSYDTAVNGPVIPLTNVWVTAGVTQSFSGMFYTFLTNVAEQVAPSNIMVGALAYVGDYLPPDNISSFPNNVQVEVCMYGAPTLLTSSPANASIKSNWEAWHSKVSRLCCYDYTLLHTDYWQTNEQLETPLVAAIVDRAKFLNSIGALNGGCQATYLSIMHNPWNYYAYPRIRWDISKTAQNIESNFFYDYFGESGAPMLAYYQTLENNVISNNINSHLHGYCYTIAPGEFSIPVLYQMQTELTLAESLATNWVTRSRLAVVSNDFAWLLSQENLTGVNLNDPTPYQQVGSSPVTLDLSNFVALNTIAGSSGTPWNNNPIFTASPAYWQLGNPSSIQKTLNLLQSGIYAVTASVSRSIYAQSSNVVLSITLGSSTTNVTITGTNYSTFTVYLPATSGAQTLILDDWNSPAFGWTLDVNQVQIVATSLSNPAILVTPTNVGFGTILIGADPTSSFVVKNVGGGILSGTASVSAPFSIVSGGSYNLTSNQSQTVVVSFNPTTTGSYSQNVTLTGGGGATVAVSGSATNAPLPAAIQVSPTSLPFGTLLTNTSLTGTFTVQNVGGGTLSGTASVGAPFSILSGGTYNLGANQSQTVTVSFSPTTAGNYSQNLTLTGGGGATVAVSGSATNAPLPAAIQVSLKSLPFGAILTNTSRTSTFTVQNAGGGTLTGTASVGAPFSILSGGSYNLGANQSQTVTVSFNPTIVGSYNQNVTLTGGGGATVAVSGSATNAPLPTVSAISMDATDVDLNLAGLQIYAGTTVHFSAAATNAQTWQWSYAVNGGAPVVYTNSTSPITNISFAFGTNTVGNNYAWTLTVSNGPAWAQSQTNLLVEALPNSGGTVTTNYIVGPTISATSGTLNHLLTASTTINGVPTSYIYQPLPSIGSTSGGTATYSVTITNAGNYEIQALVYAPNLNANSFLVNIDSPPQNPTMIWDIMPVTSGFQERTVSWRGGTGSENNDSIVPMIFANLSAGQHTIYVVGREPGTALANFNLVQVVTTIQSPAAPAAPTGLRVVFSGQ